MLPTAGMLKFVPSYVFLVALLFLIAQGLG